MKKKTEVNQYELPVEIKKDGDWYIAKCSIWSDCYAQGETIDEALSEITAVAAGLIELYAEEGKQVPLTKVKTQESTKTFSFNLPILVSSV